MTRRATYAVQIRNRVSGAVELVVCEGVTRQDAEAAWDGARRRLDLAQAAVIVNEQTGRCVKRQASVMGPAR